MNIFQTGYLHTYFFPNFIRGFKEITSFQVFLNIKLIVQAVGCIHLFVSMNAYTHAVPNGATVGLNHFSENCFRIFNEIWYIPFLLIIIKILLRTNFAYILHAFHRSQIVFIRILIFLFECYYRYSFDNVDK